MRQSPVGEPAATDAANFAIPRRRSSVNRLCPFRHCRQRYIRSLRRIQASRFVSRREVCDHLLQTDPSRPACEFPDSVSEFVEGFRRYASLAPVIRNAESEKFTFLGSRHRAFGLVDFQAELVGQEPAYRGPHPFAGVEAANINVAVIRVTAEPVTTSSQFLVEIVEHDITEEGRERTALRGPFVHRSDQTIFQYPGIQECPDKLEHAFIGYPCGDARHQDVVVNSVEKSFQIEINHNVVAIGDVTLCLGYSLVGGPPRPKSETVLRKRRIPSLLENLQHGLLNQAVDDTGDAEFSDPAIRLRDFYPLNRLRPIVSVKQLRPNVWPVLTQESLRVVDGHPINARASFVPFNTLPRSFEVLSVAHLLH